MMPLEFAGSSRALVLLSLLSLGAVSQPALAGISLGVSGSGSKNSLGLKTLTATAVSANIMMDLGDYFRIGLTHRRSFEHEEGLKEVQIGDSAGLIRFTDDTMVTTNSFDLTLVLYRGLVSPFVFGGVASKTYLTELEYTDYNAKKTEKNTLWPLPNYGFGVAIFLNQNFDLRITQTYSEGEKISFEQNDVKKHRVSDTYTQVGINYRI